MVWLGNPLNITFNTSGNCRGYVYLLWRNGVPLHVPHDVDDTVAGVEFVTITVTNVTKDFDNASMQIIGTNGNQNMIIVKRFTIHTQGQ